MKKAFIVALAVIAMPQLAAAQGPVSPARVVRGIDHIGMTVPDIAAATRFFEKAFGAQLLYDPKPPSTPPRSGPDVAARLGVSPEAQQIATRMLRLGTSVNVELFQWGGVPQQPAATTSDLGLNHLSLYVDDIDEAAHLVVAAGGKLLKGPNPMQGTQAGAGNRNMYTLTPWGTIIELVTIPTRTSFDRTSALHRFKPKKQR